MLKRMPVLTPQHRRLAGLAGEYRGEEHVESSEWTAGGVSPATLRLRLAADGLVLVEDDESAAVRGHGVLSIDPDSGEVVRHWWDSIGPPSESARGGWTGDDLVLERSSPRGTNRTSWTLEGDVLRQTVAVRAPGEREFAILVRATHRRG
jgi:hypothetical protein